jgi:hypothetical protein
MSKKKKLKNKNKTLEQSSKFDTQGSYTGVDAFDRFEVPIQDADDL